MKGKIGSSCEKAAVCVRASKLGELLQHHACIAPGSCKVDHGQMSNENTRFGGVYFLYSPAGIGDEECWQQGCRASIRGKNLQGIRINSLRLPPNLVL